MMSLQLHSHVGQHSCSPIFRLWLGIEYENNENSNPFQVGSVAGQKKLKIEMQKISVKKCGIRDVSYIFVILIVEWGYMRKRLKCGDTFAM
jgi:hypothetical protein